MSTINHKMMGRPMLIMQAEDMKPIIEKIVPELILGLKNALDNRYINAFDYDGKTIDIKTRIYLTARQLEDTIDNFREYIQKYSKSKNGVAITFSHHTARTNHYANIFLTIHY